MARTAGSTNSSKLGDGSARTVVSIPPELTAALDARINEAGGEALKNLGVGPETLRTGFVHKILKDALAAELEAQAKA